MTKTIIDMSIVEHILRRAAAAVVCAALLPSCSDSFAGDADDLPAPTDGGEVVIAVSELAPATAASRVLVESDDDRAGGAVTLRWSDGDSFGLWASGATEADEYENMRFTYREGRFPHEEGRIYFASHDVPKMDSGEYSYRAFYPYTDNADREANTLTYTLSSSQTGIYDGSCDIMTAQADRSAALVRDRFNTGMELAFRHETHALKITVPSGSNLFARRLGSDVKVTRIRIEFPQPVTGTLTFSAATGQLLNVPENNFVDVIFDDENPFEEDKPFWVFVAPADMSTGDVKFTAFGGENEKYQSDPSVASAGSFGRLERAHITPVKLGIKRGFSVTWFDYIVNDLSRLGEDVQSLNLTLPEGLQSADRIDDNGVKKIAADAEGRFRVSFRTQELSEMLETAGQIDLQPRYESEHALLPPYAEDLGKFVITAQSYREDDRNEYTIDYVPYLFEEDFNSLAKTVNHDDNLALSGTSADYGSNNGYKLDDAGLNDWSGARVGAYKADDGYVRILNRSQYAGFVAMVAGNYRGRIDSPAMANLKEDASVSLNISFNYSMDRDRNSSYEFIPHYFAVGTHERSGAISTDNGKETTLGSSAFAIDRFLSDNFNGDRGSYLTLVAPDCNPRSRFVWEVYVKQDIDRPSGIVAGNYHNYWLYLDNVKVSIAASRNNE